MDSEYIQRESESNKSKPHPLSGEHRLSPEVCRLGQDTQTQPALPNTGEFTQVCPQKHTTELLKDDSHETLQIMPQRTKQIRTKQDYYSQLTPQIKLK